MSAVVHGLGAAPAGERAEILRHFTEFQRAGDDPLAYAGASRAYTTMVLSVALARPSEILLACNGGRPVGRAMAVASEGVPGAAAIGLFEVDDGPGMRPTGRALVDAACQWAAERGCHQILAPVDVNSWFEYRFPIPAEGVGATIPPFAWEPSQPAAYLEIFRSEGFTDAERYHTIGGTFEDAAAVATPVGLTAGAYGAAVGRGYAFERMADGSRLIDLLDELHPLCSEAFRDNPLFEPLPIELFRGMYATAIATRDCSLSHVVRDPTGGLAGFIFAFVDREATVIVKTIAVASAHRGRHLSTALTHAVLARGAELGFAKYVSALVRHGNRSEFLAQPYLIPGLRSWTHEYVLLRRDGSQ